MKKLLSSILILSSILTSFASDKEIQKEAEAPISKFMDLKFGMFVHWGPVALRGTEIGWSRGRPVPNEEYDMLYKEFNPIKFNANEWIKTLKDAGMKYFIITTRHHDGFSLWPSNYTDYDISATPFKKDILMEMKKACDKYGIMFGTYYSVSYHNSVGIKSVCRQHCINRYKMILEE